MRKNLYNSWARPGDDPVSPSPSRSLFFFLLGIVCLYGEVINRKEKCQWMTIEWVGEVGVGVEDTGQQEEGQEDQEE